MLQPVRDTMRDLAKSFKPEELAEKAFGLYVQFRFLSPASDALMNQERFTAGCRQTNTILPFRRCPGKCATTTHEGRNLGGKANPQSHPIGFTAGSIGV